MVVLVQQHLKSVVWECTLVTNFIEFLLQPVTIVLEVDVSRTGAC